LPLRIVFESLKADVSWDGETSSVLVNRQAEIAIGSELMDKAKDFELVDQFGKTITLESRLGKPVLLSFYSTW